MRNKSTFVFDLARKKLRDPAVIAAHRVRPQDWSRHRKLKFGQVVLHLLRHHKLPTSVGLLKLFKELDDMENLPTPN